MINTVLKYDLCKHIMETCMSLLGTVNRPDLDTSQYQDARGPLGQIVKIAWES